ncbi:MAG: aspartate aminotransferase family protein [Promethearchaeota archaeon]
MTSSFLEEELEKARKLRPKSAKLWEKAQEVLPGGISHTIRTFDLHLIGGIPLFIKSANGPFLVDVDENKYIDCWNGHFAMILGHNHPQVKESVKEAIEQGWHFGTNTQYQVELANTIINDNKSIEKIRFCTSGTESTMYAIRLARAYTKKRLVAKAKLGWHGANDTLYYCVGSFDENFVPPGLIKAKDAKVTFFEINDEKIFEIIKENGKEMAALILEPVLGGGGGFPASTEFLKRLREETESRNIILIFDEVITGYRFLYGLYQEDIKVYPDLTTMGKIIGGGFPIGAVGGREDIIERSAPNSKNQVLIGGGTFSGYPISMIAGLKTLEILKNSKEEYERINKASQVLLNNLNEYFKSEKIPIIATGYKSIIMLHVLSKWIENPSVKEIVLNTNKKREALLHLALFNRNISGLHGLGSLSMAHAKEHIDQIEKTVKSIARPVAFS